MPGAYPIILIGGPDDGLQFDSAYLAPFVMGVPRRVQVDDRIEVTRYQLAGNPGCTGSFPFGEVHSG